MAICDMGHEHPDETVPVVVEADPGPNANDVAIAEVEAAASIERAKINAETEIAWQESRVAGLEGQVRGMREILDRIAPPEPEPEPEPEPVVVVPDAPAAEDDNDAPPEIAKPKKETSGGGMWDSYR